MASLAANKDGEGAKKSRCITWNWPRSRLINSRCTNARGWPGGSVCRHAFDGDNVKVVAMRAVNCGTGEGNRGFCDQYLEPEVTGEFKMGYEEVNHQNGLGARDSTAAKVICLALWYLPVWLRTVIWESMDGPGIGTVRRLRTVRLWKWPNQSRLPRGWWSRLRFPVWKNTMGSILIWENLNSCSRGYMARLSMMH